MNRFLTVFFGLMLLCATAHGQKQPVPVAGPWGANTQFHESFKVGDTIPDDLKFYRDTGELVSANEMFRKSHTVIISGCLTCGMFRRTYPSVEAVYRDYKDQDVDFYFVYQTLQHPENHSYVQAFSMKERFLQLEVAKKEYATTVPWLLDTFDNNWKAYFQVRPNSEIIFDNKGRMVHVQPWVSQPNLRNALEKIFGPVENPTQVADLGLPEIQPVSGGDRTDVVKRVKVSGNALTVSFRPLMSEQTYYAKLRPEIDQALYDSGKGQMYIGLHLDPIYKVHWNNYEKPVTYQLSLPEGVSASPLKGEGPLPDVDTDKDPREFLIDIDNWKARDEPIGIDIFYVACNKEEGWCKPVKQSYEIHLKHDKLQGKVHGRSFEVDGLPQRDSENRPRQKSASAELLKLDPNHVEGLKLRARLGTYYGPSKIGETLTNSLGMKLTYIPAGEFTMGSPSGESDRDDDETQHRVRLSRPFWLGVTEVTQGQWEALMGSRPWEGKSAKSNPSHAASYVSWDDAVEFCRKLSERAGKAYRLPTEAEWEYACRGGTTSMYHFGDNVSELGRFGWFADNAKNVGERDAHVVRQKLPNGWGLYDMHGNVYEWCGDWYGDYPSGTVTDPKGPGSGSDRVLRGGSWFSYPLFCRPACRYGTSPGLQTHNLGFRLALDF